MPIRVTIPIIAVSAVLVSVCTSSSRQVGATVFPATSSTADTVAGSSGTISTAATSSTTATIGVSKTRSSANPVDRIGFTKFDGDSTEIWVMNADGTDQTRLTTLQGISRGPLWSPDGTRIAFTSNRDNSDGNPDLWVMSTDGTDQTRLTNGAIPEGLSWSPDGTRIAFTPGHPSTFIGEIWVVNADGTDLTRLTGNLGPGVGSQPAWSPDGTKIAFAGVHDADEEIYVMNADGTDQTTLTTVGAAGQWWSPDSARIAFISDPYGDAAIYVMKADGTDQTRLADIPGTRVLGTAFVVTGRHQDRLQLVSRQPRRRLPHLGDERRRHRPDPPSHRGRRRAVMVAR